MQKMDKIHVVQFLLDEIAAEKWLFEEYQMEVTRANAQAKKEGKHSWNCMQWPGRIPSKARIIANAVKIRQLMLEVAKECE